MGRVLDGFFLLHSPRIRCGKKDGQYFANAGPLYLRKIIFCVLITLQGIRFNETLEQYGYDRARICLNRDAVPDVPLHINHVFLPPRPREACVKHRKG